MVKLEGYNQIMKKIDGENLKLAGIDLTEDGLKLKFRSGGEYSVKRDRYAEAAADAFVSAGTGDDVCSVIKDARNGYIKSHTRKGKKPVFIKGVITEKHAAPDGEKTPFGDIANKAWDDFVFKWGDQLAAESDSVFESEDSGREIENDLVGWAYTQTGDNLVKRVKDRDYVLVQGEKPAYYYTDHSTSNGYEVWYKAIDPFSFFGVNGSKR